jgi:hypothetical protein
MNNNQYNDFVEFPKLDLLLESLEYKDLDGLVKNTIHVDEFSSKMGDDDDIIVLSFFVRDNQAAKDLMNWFEKGYDFVLDADRSPGEIRPGRYLVYVEIRRRSTAGAHAARLIDDLQSLTEHEPNEWVMHYRDQTVPFSQETFEQLVPLSPRAYREKSDKNLDEMRIAAGLPMTSRYDARDPELQVLRSGAGL